MAELGCGVRNCVYNKDEYCCKGDILVGGRKASREDETCCESFAQRRGETIAYTSSLSHPGKIISIDCEAVKCVYNSNYKCVAEHVDITGNGAGDSRETACATFTEK